MHLYVFVCICMYWHVFVCICMYLYVFVCICMFLCISMLHSWVDHCYMYFSSSFVGKYCICICIYICMFLCISMLHGWVGGYLAEIATCSPFDSTQRITRDSDSKTLHYISAYFCILIMCKNISCF